MKTNQWLKWPKGFTSRTDVLRVSAKASVTPREAASMLMEIAEWFDTTGHRLPAGTLRLGLRSDSVCKFIDDHTKPGFAVAMQGEGWIVFDADGCLFTPPIARNKHG